MLPVLLYIQATKVDTAGSCQGSVSPSESSWSSPLVLEVRLMQLLDDVSRFLRSNRQRIRQMRRRMAQNQRFRKLEPNPLWYGLDSLVTLPPEN